jgi:ribonuclease HII
MKKKHWIVGVDEAGRGPLAGPVAVGVAVVPHDFDWNRIPGVGDSKKVSPKNREAIFQQARELQRADVIDFHVALVSHRVIDQINIARAVDRGIATCFKKLALNPHSTTVKLDGLLKAPEAFVNQETIIKGDALERVIGLASILAKVTRDTYMVRISRRFTPYSFDIHKGYGTSMHRAAIRRLGLTEVHRATFCRNIVSVK